MNKNLPSYSVVFLIVSVAFAIGGIYTMYESSGELISLRCLGWICVGIISAIIGCTFAILSKE